MLVLDHIAVAGETREAAAQYVASVLGIPMLPGGKHAVFGTHNQLLGLESDLYLEAIAVDPEAPSPQRKRWFGLDNFQGSPRLTNWICQTDDIVGMVRELPEAGDIVSLERGELRWRMAVPAGGQLPFDGCFPAIIQWDCELHPSSMLPGSGCSLQKLSVTHPEANALQQRLAPYFRDARVAFQVGAIRLQAEFSTANGERTLS